MSEVIYLDEKQSERLRLKRAERLMILFEPRNASLVNGLESLLDKIAYEALEKSTSNGTREQALGKRDFALGFITRIKEEIDWAKETIENEKIQGG
jgi:hypothetical protein